MVKVYFDMAKYVEVTWCSNDLYVNVGWLMSETLRKLSERPDFDK